MKLTIIPFDRIVYLDNIAYGNLDLSDAKIPNDIHALQWVGDSGWLEFKDNSDNKVIHELPDWAYVCIKKWEEVDYVKNNPLPPTAEQNKLIATSLLIETDWINQPDVIILNKDEFLDYRAIVRQYIITPISGNITWPIKPKAIWN